MTPEQVTLVQESFRKILPKKEAAAELFFRRLFELDPGLRPMFREDLKRQGHELMEMLATAVRGLNDLGNLLPAVRDCGRRHAGYGVEPRHYGTAGAALLWTLEQGLGEDYTEEVKQAWASLYGLLSMIMMEAGRQRAA